MNSLKVCVDARLVSGEAGGVEQFIIGLVSGLSKLADGPEEYLVLVYADSKEWIMPFIGGRSRVLQDGNYPRDSLAKRLIQRVPGMMNRLHGINPRVYQRAVSQAKSNGIIESAGIEIMHFTMQTAFLTAIPSIYHPHDLQHIHLPQMFTLRKRMLRDQMYRVFCEQARMVAVGSNSVKRDLIEHYHLPAEKVKVVSLAPVVTSYGEPSFEQLIAVQKKFSLPSDFVFYPAQTWPHKNHINLLKALALLRDQSDIKINAVFSGKKEQFYESIENKVRELNLENQVYFLGFVDPMELRSLYKLSKAVVIPTKFEAASFPLWEAFIVGVPAACSTVTSLPEQASDAALLFDPDSPQEIACQILRLWTDQELRSSLVEKGKRNVSRFSWERTARIFRAHYRQIAQRPLTPEDGDLINSPGLF